MKPIVDENSSISNGNHRKFLCCRIVAGDSLENPSKIGHWNELHNNILAKNRMMQIKITMQFKKSRKG